MSKYLLSIVYESCLDIDENRAFDAMLRRTSGIPHSRLEILRYHNDNQFTLSEIYNRGLTETRSDLVLFIRPDTLFLEDNWGDDLIKLISESDFGILGIAGTNELVEDSGVWFHSGSRSSLGLIFYPDGSGGMIDYWWSDRLDFIAPAVVIDGVFMLAQKSRIKKNFDEGISGHQYYDVAFCLRNHQCGVKIGVIMNHSIKLYHHTKTFPFRPEAESLDILLNKYPGSFTVETLLDAPQQKFIHKNTAPVVHIIILTKDKVELLSDLLDSIVSHTDYPNYCVWVGDTGSKEVSKSLIQRKMAALNRKLDATWPSDIVAGRPGACRFNYIDIGEYHYSKSNNRMITFIETRGYCVEGDFILFCNNDIKLVNNCIDGCLYEYERMSETGASIGTMGIKLLYQDNRIQHFGIDIFRYSHKNISINHRYLNHSYQNSDREARTVGNTGAFMFVEFSVFKLIGGFNERYNDVYQDVEFNLECLKNGMQNVTLGHLVAYHYESQTRGDDTTVNSKWINDWEEVLSHYIKSNFSLVRHFRQTADSYEKYIYHLKYEIDFKKRYSSSKVGTANS